MDYSTSESEHSRNRDFNARTILIGFEANGSESDISSDFLAAWYLAWK